jgi:hypothetical protein
MWIRRYMRLLGEEEKFQGLRLSTDMLLSLPSGMCPHCPKDVALPLVFPKEVAGEGMGDGRFTL